jgi:hypothetical protein
MLYLFPIFKNTPILNFEYKKHEAWLKDQVEGRKKVRKSFWCRVDKLTAASR